MQHVSDKSFFQINSISISIAVQLQITQIVESWLRNFRMCKITSQNGKNNNTEQSVEVSRALDCI